MNRDQILAGCRIAHAEFEAAIGMKLSMSERMLYQSAFVAGALFYMEQQEARTKAVLRLVGRAE